MLGVELNGNSMRMILYIFVGLVLLVLLGFWLVPKLPAFGSPPAAAQRASFGASPQWNGETFQNTLPTEMMLPGTSYWKLMREQFRAAERAPKTALPYRNNAWQPSDTSFHYHWLGHSTLYLQKNGLHLLLDPIFDQRASPFQFAGSAPYPGMNQFSLAQLPAIDYVLITHDHYDHLDYTTIQALAKQSGIRFIVPLGVGSHLQRWGVGRERITELDWWQELELPGALRLVMTPARHFSGRGLHRNNTLWASYSFIWPDQRVFASGDSGYGTHFSEIGEKLGPFDLAFIENGQYNQAWPYIHLAPEQGWQACIDLRARWVQPIHWGKYTLALHRWDEPVQRLHAAAGADSLRLLTPIAGEPVALQPPMPVERWWRDPAFQ